jgi:WD40 repeat protein
LLVPQLSLYKSLSPAIGGINAVAISPNRRWVASAGGGSPSRASRDSRTWSLRLHAIAYTDARDAAESKDWQTHDAKINAICFSPDGKEIIAGSGDIRKKSSLSSWIVPLMRLNFAQKPEQGAFCSIAYQPDGKSFYTGNHYGSMSWWSRGGLTQYLKWKAHRREIYALCVSADGESIYSGGDDCVIRVWDSAFGEEIRSLQGHDRAVRSLALSPDNTILASGSDQRIKIWDTGTGKVRHSFYGHADWVRGVAITPDNRFLISTGDRKIKIWDLETANKLSTIEAHDAPIQALSFSRDGSLLATGCSDGIVKIWHLEYKED